MASRCTFCTSQIATNCTSRFFRKWPKSSRPRPRIPMAPSTVRLLGAIAPLSPRAEPGITVGIARAAPRNRPDPGTFVASIVRRFLSSSESSCGSGCGLIHMSNVRQAKRHVWQVQSRQFRLSCPHESRGRRDERDAQDGSSYSAPVAVVGGHGCGRVSRPAHVPIHSNRTQLWAGLPTRPRPGALK